MKRLQKHRLCYSTRIILRILMPSLLGKPLYPYWNVDSIYPVQKEVRGPPHTYLLTFFQLTNLLHPSPSHPLCPFHCLTHTITHTHTSLPAAPTCRDPFSGSIAPTQSHTRILAPILAHNHKCTHAFTLFTLTASRLSSCFCSPLPPFPFARSPPGCSPFGSAPYAW